MPQFRDKLQTLASKLLKHTEGKRSEESSAHDEFLKLGGVSDVARKLSTLRDSSISALLIFNVMLSHAKTQHVRQSYVDYFVSEGALSSLSEVFLHTLYANEEGRPVVCDTLCVVRYIRAHTKNVTHYKETGVIGICTKVLHFIVLQEMQLGAAARVLSVEENFGKLSVHPS